MIAETPTDQAPPAKRRKHMIACQECKHRKKRCDGVRPVCGACGAKNNSHNCSYSSDRTKRAEELEYIRALEDKIRNYESFKDTPPPASTVIHSTSSRRTPAYDEAHQYEHTRQLTPRLPAPVPHHWPNHQDSQSLGAHPSSDPIPEIGLPRRDFFDATQPEARLEPLNFIATTPRRVLDDGFMSIRSRKNISEAPGVLEESDAEEEAVDDEPSENHDDEGVDSMGAMAGNVNNTSPSSTLPKRHQYYGSSSTSSLMQQIQEVLHPRGVYHSKRSPGRPLCSFSTESLSKLSSINVVLPPRSLADALVNSYWAWLHPLYPFLQKSAFQKQYAQLWSVDGNEHTINHDVHRWSHDLFNCLLNLVFALGCQYCAMIDPAERSEAGNTFYKRSRSFLDFGSLDNGSIELVQALLLTGQFLQSTGKSGACWNIVGLAIRAAQGIGLHLCQDKTDTEPPSQLESETKKRVWAGCLLFDRVTWMMFGRPPMISMALAREVALPLAIDDDFMTAAPEGPACQPEGLPSTTAFFVEAVKLLEHVGEVLSTSYGESSTMSMTNSESNTSSRSKRDMMTGNYEHILQLDNAITAWQEGLPSHLQWNDGNWSGSGRSDMDPGTNAANPFQRFGDNTTLFYRQAGVLQARFLHLKILLSRPLLSMSFAQAQIPTGISTFSGPIAQVLHTSLTHQISAYCVATAQSLVELVQKNIFAGGDGLPAWWYNIFYLYTCATVVLAGRLCPPIDTLLRERSLESTWNGCLQGLETYRQQSRFAEKCMKILQLIDARIFLPLNITTTLPGANEPSQNRNQPDSSTLGTSANYHGGEDMTLHGYMSMGNDIGNRFEMETSFPNQMDLSTNGAAWYREMQNTSWSSSFPFDLGVDVLSGDMYS